MLLTLLSLIACTYEGGQDYAQYTHAEILEYSVSEGEEKWIRVGEMAKPRAAAAVSVVDLDDFRYHCQASS